MSEASVTVPNPVSGGSGLSSKVYDVLKHIAQIILPALGTLYFAVAGIWHLPSANEVVGTITAVDAFLGVALGLSSANYNKSDASVDGFIDVSQDEVGKITASLNLNDTPDALLDKSKVAFKVNPLVPGDS